MSAIGERGTERGGRLTDDVRATLAAVLNDSGGIRTVSGSSPSKRLTLQHSAEREQRRLDAGADANRGEWDETYRSR